MVNIVITGSSRGIGLAMAIKMLQLGNNVVITSRDISSVENVVGILNTHFGDHVAGVVCDVTEFEAVEALGKFALDSFGSIDVWVNNAGTSSHRAGAIWETDLDSINTIVDTNLKGVLYGCITSIKIMLKQGSGNIFNMDGWGANGMPSPLDAVYGATKRALPQLMKSLNEELKGTSVGVHTLSPGMVLTDLLLSGKKNQYRIYNILAETPQTVAEFLVPKVLSTRGKGKYYKVLTSKKASWRFMTSWRFKDRFFREGELMVMIDPITTMI